MKNIKEIKKERMEVVKELYAKKVPVQDIAKELGCAISTVSGYIRELGLREIKTEQLNKIIKEMYVNGKTIVQICFELDLTRTYVCSVIKKNRLNKNHFVVRDHDLIDENTKYAEDRKANKNYEKIEACGKIYKDVTHEYS